MATIVQNGHVMCLVVVVLDTVRPRDWRLVPPRYIGIVDGKYVAYRNHGVLPAWVGAIETELP